jgi:hypothetical protein
MISNWDRKRKEYETEIPLKEEEDAVGMVAYIQEMLPLVWASN